jgi:hypothetical protein
MTHPREAATFQTIQNPCVIVYRRIGRTDDELQLMCLSTVGGTKLHQWINNVVKEIDGVHFLTLQQKIWKRTSTSARANGAHVFF